MRSLSTIFLRENTKVYNFRTHIIILLLYKIILRSFRSLNKIDIVGAVIGSREFFFIYFVASLIGSDRWAAGSLLPFKTRTRPRPRLHNSRSEPLCVAPHTCVLRIITILYYF